MFVMTEYMTGLYLPLELVSLVKDLVVYFPSTCRAQPVPLKREVVDPHLDLWCQEVLVTIFVQCLNIAFVKLRQQLSLSV